MDSVSGHGELGSCCFWKTTVDESATSTSLESKEISRCRRTADSFHCAERVSLDARDLNEALDRIARQAQRVLNLRQRIWSATNLKGRWRKGATYSDFCSL